MIPAKISTRTVCCSVVTLTNLRKETCVCMMEQLNEHFNLKFAGIIFKLIDTVTQQ